MDFKKLQETTNYRRNNNRAIVFVLLLVLNLLLVDAYLMPPTDEQKLVRYLTANYSKLGKPGVSYTVPIMIQARFFPVKLQNLLEKDETLQMTIRMQLNWKDPALQFDPLQFNNQSSVILPGGSVWIPDLQISNSMSDLYGILRDPRFDFKVYSDGTVWWHPTGNIATRCEIWLAYFPFDYQRCRIVIESGIYTHNQLNLTLRYDKTAWSKSMYAESGHWDLVAIKARSRLKYVTNSTAFTSVEFWIFLGRKSGYYKLNIIFPCGMLSALQMLTFFLPLESSERVPEATTILLSVIVFQSMIIQDLPRSSDSMPLLCVYIDLLTGISVVSVGEAVLIAYLVSRKQERRFCPTWAMPLLKLLYRVRIADPIGDQISSSRSETEFGCSLNRYDSQIVRRSHGTTPSLRQYQARNNNNNSDYNNYPTEPAFDYYDHPHCYHHRRNCIWCYEADCHRRGSALTNDFAGEANETVGYGLRHRESFNRRKRREQADYYLQPPPNNQREPAADASSVSFLKNRPNGSVPDGNNKAVFDDYNQEATDNRHNNNLLCENLKQIAGRGANKLRRQLSRSSSRMRPILLAPLARLDGGSDSSDYELSETNFGNIVISPAEVIENETINNGSLTSPPPLPLVPPLEPGVIVPPVPIATVESEKSSKILLENLDTKNKEKDVRRESSIRTHLKVSRNNKDDTEAGGDSSPFTSITTKKRQQRGTLEKRRNARRTTAPLLIIDWIFLAKVVDYVAFVCCLFAITGVPLFLFRIIPPDSPDYNLDNHF